MNHEHQEDGAGGVGYLFVLCVETDWLGGGGRVSGGGYEGLEGWVCRRFMGLYSEGNRRLGGEGRRWKKSGELRLLGQQ